MFINGRGVERDEIIGFDMLSKAAEQENSWSQTSLGMAYLYGYGTEVSIPEAATLCRSGVGLETKCADYCVGLAYFFQDKNDPVVTVTEAEEMLLKAAGLGHACAATLLGVAYSVEEFKTDSHLDQAEKWLRIAVGLGSVDAKYNLGSFLVQYRGQEIEDGSEALELLADAAESDHLLSVCALAAFNLSNENGEPRLYPASRYLKRLVKLGEMSENEASKILADPEFYADDLLDRYDFSTYTHPDFRSGSSALQFEPIIVEGFQIVVEDLE